MACFFVGSENSSFGGAAGAGYNPDLVESIRRIFFILMKTLDFLIIGAQKSGTTTLFKLLAEHSKV